MVAAVHLVWQKQSACTGDGGKMAHTLQNTLQVAGVTLAG